MRVRAVARGRGLALLVLPATHQRAHAEDVVQPAHPEAAQGQQVHRAPARVTHHEPVGTGPAQRHTQHLRLHQHGSAARREGPRRNHGRVGACARVRVGPAVRAVVRVTRGSAGRAAHARATRTGACSAQRGSWAQLCVRRRRAADTLRRHRDRNTHRYGRRLGRRAVVVLARDGAAGHDPGALQHAAGSRARRSRRRRLGVCGAVRSGRRTARRRPRRM
mmetsp:Transcript_59309/g.164101  ORF Transcript_59309/g.164101 Transcript_59309/m.164101 type:complete len:220 (-) Transcript_59309:76-735(-)